MPESRSGLVASLGLAEISGYQEDASAALRLYFSPVSPAFTSRFLLKSPLAVQGELKMRLDETDARSCLALLTSLEANFRIDFDNRCKQKLKDPLSRHFREAEKRRGNKVRLEEDILEGWRIHGVIDGIEFGQLLSQLKSAFKFRHWMAHGRYWTPKFGRKYDFTTTYLIAEAIISQFPFVV